MAASSFTMRSAVHGLSGAHPAAQHRARAVEGQDVRDGADRSVGERVAGHVLFYLECEVIVIAAAAADGWLRGCG